MNNSYPTYIPRSEVGIKLAGSRNNGRDIFIQWNKAYPTSNIYSIGYNIYFSTIKEDVFNEGAKFVVVNQNQLDLEITDLTPGDVYYFAVRAFQYDSSWYNLSLLPDSGDNKYYPDGILLNNISATDGYIPVSDIETFPSYGIIQIGGELIKYSNKDLVNSKLINITRGYFGSNARMHMTDGYDGVHQQNYLVKFWPGLEDQNLKIMESVCDFNIPNVPSTDLDGYRQITKDLLTTDLSASELSQKDFPRYDYVGWHRTNPISVLNGDCIGTYIGGEQYCADGYSGVGRMVRGLPLQSASHQRQELLLNLTGEPCILIQKQRTGIRCSCVLQTTEFAEDRCEKCHGSGFLTGYQQYFNTRRSDGKIMVRFGPTEDDLKLEDNGMESTFMPNCWTLVTPIVKDRDFIIRFNEDGTEEYRYEILNVTRNKLLQGLSGVQKFRLQRVRKTDPIYHFRYNVSTAEIPTNINTSIGFTSGLIAPHYHTIVISNKTTNINQINQTTSISSGHSHKIRNGVVEEVLGHTHSIEI